MNDEHEDQLDDENHVRIDRTLRNRTLRKCDEKNIIIQKKYEELKSRKIDVRRYLIDKLYSVLKNYPILLKRMQLLLLPIKNKSLDLSRARGISIEVQYKNLFRDAFFIAYGDPLVPILSKEEFHTIMQILDTGDSRNKNGTLSKGRGAPLSSLELHWFDGMGIDTSLSIAKISASLASKRPPAKIDEEYIRAATKVIQLSNRIYFSQYPKFKPMQHKRGSEILNLVCFYLASQIIKHSIETTPEGKTNKFGLKGGKCPFEIFKSMNALCRRLGGEQSIYVTFLKYYHRLTNNHGDWLNHPLDVVEVFWEYRLGMDVNKIKEMINSSRL